MHLVGSQKENFHLLFDYIFWNPGSSRDTCKTEFGSWHFLRDVYCSKTSLHQQLKCLSTRTFLITTVKGIKVNLFCEWLLFLKQISCSEKSLFSSCGSKCFKPIQRLSVVNYFCKTLLLRCLTRSWIRLCLELIDELYWFLNLDRNTIKGESEITILDRRDETWPSMLV